MLKLFKKNDKKMKKDAYDIDTLVYEVTEIAKSQKEEIEKLKKLNDQLKEIIRK